MQRRVCGMSCCGTAAVVVGVEYVGLGGTAGSRFKGSVRDGLNSVVADFAVGSRFKGSVRNGLNGAVGPGFTIGSRFKGSIRDGSNGAVGPGVGAPCGGRLAGARSPAATARLGLPRGLVAVGAVCDIAGFPAVCLTDMVGVPNRSNQESHSATLGTERAVAVTAGRQHRASEAPVAYLAACGMLQGGCDAEGGGVKIRLRPAR